MTYTFRGFITNDAAAVNAALALWPFCVARHAGTQMDGYVIRSPCEDDLPHSASDEEYEHVLKQIAEVEENLPQLAQQFATSCFVYVVVECFGGDCVHSGYHLSGGKLIHHFPKEQETTSLGEILQPLGVKLAANDYFTPFTRGYFTK